MTEAELETKIRNTAAEYGVELVNNDGVALFRDENLDGWRVTLRLRVDGRPNWYSSIVFDAESTRDAIAFVPVEYDVRDACHRLRSAVMLPGDVRILELGARCPHHPENLITAIDFERERFECLDADRGKLDQFFPRRYAVWSPRERCHLIKPRSDAATMRALTGLDVPPPEVP